MALARAPAHVDHDTSSTRWTTVPCPVTCDGREILRLLSASTARCERVTSGSAPSRTSRSLRQSPNDRGAVDPLHRSPTLVQIRQVKVEARSAGVCAAPAIDVAPHGDVPGSADHVSALTGTRPRVLGRPMTSRQLAAAGRPGRESGWLMGCRWFARHANQAAPGRNCCRHRVRLRPRGARRGRERLRD